MKLEVMIPTVLLALVASSAVAAQPMMTQYQRQMMCTRMASLNASMYQMEQDHVSRPVMAAVFLRMTMGRNIPKAKLESFVSNVRHIISRYEKTGVWSGDKYEVPLAKRLLHDLARWHGMSPKLNYYRYSYLTCLVNHP